MKRKLAAFDMSSFMWTHLAVGKDKENGYTVTHEEKEVYINSWIYGYDNVMDRMIDLLAKHKLQPIDCILVFEGANSKSRRQLINQGYKAGSSRAPEWYVEFEKLRDQLKQVWRDMGAQVLTQDAAEGDDVLAWLAHNTEEDMIVFTFDNDLTVLNLHPNQYGAHVSTWINQMFEYNKYGVFDYDLVTTYKALVGDPSDKITGCPGFGEKAFEGLCEAIGYDGLRQVHEMLHASDLSPLAECLTGPEKKYLQKILDNAPAVINSFDLARVRPEWVNTMRMPLKWEPGMVRQRREDDDPRLKKYFGQTWLVTAENYEEAIAWALPRIKASREVSLDIEGSTPDESDEWLALQGKDDDSVDVFGSYLVGLGLTFGPNNQYTMYFSVRHADVPGATNIASETLRQFIAQIPQDIPLVIQNVNYELTVLFNEWGARQLDNGYHGFLPNVLDTAIEASYVDENSPRGLKDRSRTVLGYQQQTFKETVEITAHPSELFAGGKVVAETYETHEVGTGKFEQVTDPETGATYERETMKTEQVLVGTGEFETVPVTDGKGKPKVDKATGEPLMETREIMQPVVKTQTRRYKMHELPASHVLGYGADDPICTIALHNHYKLFMQLEHTWQVYLQVEIDAAYMHAKSYIDGCDISIEKLKELSAADDVTYDKNWAVLRQYLIDEGWEGVNPPQYTVDISAKEVKEAFQIVTGRPLDTQTRTISKLATLARVESGEEQFASMLEMLLAAKDGPDVLKAEAAFNKYVQSYFKGEPQFNDGSPKQMQRLLYEVMGLTIKVRNKPTDIMRANGIYEGTPKTDALAIAYAMIECDDYIKKYTEIAEHAGPGEEHDDAMATVNEARRIKQVLEALKLMAMVGTRRSLYYDKYPYFPHWKDGKLRSQHNQASTNTRRASESSPNKQQLPKSAKVEGYDAKFRQVIVPHRTDAVIVSMDFSAQELRIIADYCRDPNMVACYVGDDLKDLHALTGLGIAKHMRPDVPWTYDLFMVAIGDESHELHKVAKVSRKLGKNTNFGAEFGAMAPKLAQMLMVSEDDAQAFLDAKEAAFPLSATWKEDVVREVKAAGIVRTKLGAVRHLGPALMSGDKWIASKAERQAVNFKVQGSAAEMTKLAEGRMWKADIFHHFDARCLGPIHDEVVVSVRVSDLPQFLPAMHACMVAPYADMWIPIESSISFGPNFYDQVEIGTQPGKAAIDSGLAEVAKKYLAPEKIAA